MLSKAAAEYLSSLKYRADAKRKVCFLPLAGIYWGDEIPDFKAPVKLPETDRDLILRLFSIRQKIWDRQKLDSDDQQFWDEARVQAPDFALFQRLNISTDDRDAQNRVADETEAAMAAWICDADQAQGKHFTKFSLSYDLTKKK